MAIYDIRQHGAVGDGVANDAAAIQTAIDACSDAGGGTVLVPAGSTFRTGSIELRSHVELHVERGAVLAGSADPADYTARLDVGALSGGVVDDQNDAALMLITARAAADIAITGAGTIDGPESISSPKISARSTAAPTSARSPFSSSAASG